MRERLIELIKGSCKKVGDYISRCDVVPTADQICEVRADYLLKNGVIVPPCKVGDKVYDISEFFDGTNCPEIYEYDVDRIEITKEKGQQVLYIADLKYPSDEWGKQLFLTRQEAEQVLKGGAAE